MEDIQTSPITNNQQIFVVPMKKSSGGLFSAFTIKAISKTLAKNKSVIIFINKKGYHTGVVCPECGYIPYCNHCDIPIGINQNNHGQLFGLCSICQEPYLTPDYCPHCKQEKLKTYGAGIQQIEHYCINQFSTKVITIESGKSNSHQKINRLFLQLQEEPLIIIATSLAQIAIYNKAHLLVMQNAIQTNIPDYNSELHNYLFVKNCIQTYKSKYIILQTYQENNPIITNIVQNTHNNFIEQDTINKLKHNYPPHGELCILSYKHEGEKQLYNKIHQLFQRILQLKQRHHRSDIEIFAIPASIYKMYDKYRYQIIIKGPIIRDFTDLVFRELKPYQHGFKCDRGAQSFL